MEWKTFFDKFCDLRAKIWLHRNIQEMTKKVDIPKRLRKTERLIFLKDWKKQKDWEKIKDWERLAAFLAAELWYREVDWESLRPWQLVNHTQNIGEVILLSDADEVHFVVKNDE